MQLMLHTDQSIHLFISVVGIILQMCTNDLCETIEMTLSKVPVFISKTKQYYIFEFDIREVRNPM